MSNEKMYIIPIHVGAISIHFEELSVQATKQTMSQEIVACLASRLSLPQTASSYCLAEVINDACGQECKERRLNASENPVQVMLLWPNNSWKSKENSYRFCLREKTGNGTGAGPADCLWTENFAMDPQVIKDYFNRFLYQPKDREYPDLCQLPDLNEQTLRENLRARFLAGHIYTYVGSILIAVNPFKFYPIYNPKYVKLYQNRRIGLNLPPHIFAVADNAYHSMLKEHKNQCIVISGESGSGKTESTNFLLHHLTALSQKGSHGCGVEQTILSAGPVLEAFGNAKTAHNNNSSRFGKFIQVNYKENGMVHGAVVQKYLLEKSRICSQGRNERNYHVFYYLLAGASEVEAKVLHLKPIGDYHYLYQSGSITLENVDEKYEFSRLKQSMEMVGFTTEKQRRLFSVLSAVLLIGNVQFQPRKLAYHHDEAVAVRNPDIVTLISDLLLVKQETLLAALTSKRARASGETLVINYRLPEAIASRDAMAKCLYGALFDWIVLQVNHALLSKKDANLEHHGKSIGVLDIFGFEDFGLCNSFEQLCINYANEHLQYYFNQHVFKYEQEEYRKESIRWTNIDFMDNTGCLHLIEGKPNGLLCILDDQCNFPGATNETLLQKFNTVHKGSQFYEVPQKRENAFIVLHYAGKVKYQAHEMREKNLDLMRQDIVSVLKNSSMAFVRELVGADPVAVFRWAIVRAFFRSYFALKAAGKVHRQNRSDKNKFVASIQNRAGCFIKERMLASTSSTSSATAAAANRHNFLSNAKFSTSKHVTNASTAGTASNQNAARSTGTASAPASVPFGSGSGPSNSTANYQRTVSRQCDYFSSKNRHLMDAAGDHYHRNRDPICISSPTSNSVLERMLCPNEARVLQKANQIVMKNKSFRPKEKTNRKSLKNLQSVKTLAGRTGLHTNTQLNKTRKQPLTVTAQFQNSLHLLMDTLNQANPFFIRCIKSNANKIANQFDDETVQRQLRYTGMLETVRIRQAGFNVRLTYDEFIQLYRILLPKGLLSSQTDVKEFLSALNLNAANYQVGVSKVFFRESEKIKLDCKLHQQIMASIIIIQRWFRACLERRRFLKLRNAVVLIQSYWRMTNAQRTLAVLRARLTAAVRIQSVWRAYSTRRRYCQLRGSLVAFQAAARGFIVRKKVHSIRVQLRHAKDFELQSVQSDEAFLSTGSSQEDLLHDNCVSMTAAAAASFTKSNESGIQTDADCETESKKRKDQNLRPTFSLPNVIVSRNNCHDKNRIENLLSEGAILDSISLRKSKLNKNYKSIDLVENDIFSQNIRSTKINDGKQPVRSSDETFESLPEHLSENAKKSLTNAINSVALPDIPMRGIRRTRRDILRRSAGEDLPDTTIPMNLVEARNSILLSTIRENATTAANYVWYSTKCNAIDEQKSVAVSGSSSTSALLQTNTGIDLKRRNSDPSSTIVMPHALAATGAANMELEWKSPNFFTIAGHRFMKIGKVSKNDRCVYCKEEMDAVVTQGHKCIECKQLFHTKCIQNRGVLQMPCLCASASTTTTTSSTSLPSSSSAASSHPKLPSTTESTFYIPESSFNSSCKNRRKYRKHVRTPYDLIGQLQESEARFQQQHQQQQPQPQSYSKQQQQQPQQLKQVPYQNHQQQQQQQQTHNHASNFSLTGMPREFTDRTDKIISDAHELQLMQDFITKKIYKIESDEGQKPSEVDRVFKQALREFKDNLVVTYSVVNKTGFESLNIKYKDLIANFFNVMETVSRQRHNDTDFPVTMGVNAFRGFMNEFMATRHEFDKPNKNKRNKKEKKRRKASDDALHFAGHSFLLTIINIPTACEICNSFFMWPLERSLVCQSCKLTCHKKCYGKIQSECAKDPSSSTHPASLYSAAMHKVFGVPLPMLLTNECKIPVIIDKLITTIEMYGLYTEGIYRKSGVSSKVKELKQKMEENSQDLINFENYQVHVLAAVLKSFLREMPEPLLTFDCYEDFIRASGFADYQERVSTLFTIIRKLPKPNYDLMERLIFHLARVALHENVNRMNTNSLAIVFAPCILRTNTILPAQDSLNDISRQTQSIEIIIVEQLRKLKSTLADIETLDTACHTASYRLSSLRCSKIFSSDDLHALNNSLSSTENEKGGKVEKTTSESKAIRKGHDTADFLNGSSGTGSASGASSVGGGGVGGGGGGGGGGSGVDDEEEALLEGHIYEIKKEKAHLTSTLPTLTRTISDEDILSTDLDGEVSLDEVTSFLLQNSIEFSSSSGGGGNGGGGGGSGIGDNYRNLVIHKRSNVIRTISGGNGGSGGGASDQHKLLRKQLSTDSAKLHSTNNKAVAECCDDTPIIV